MRQVSDCQAEWRAAVDVLRLDATDRQASGRQVDTRFALCLRVCQPAADRYLSNSLSNGVQ